MTLQELIDTGDWVLVPREPTIPMMQAAMATHNVDGRQPIGGGRVTDVYQAMIAAAPSPPQRTDLIKQVEGE